MTIDWPKNSDAVQKSLLAIHDSFARYVQEYNAIAGLWTYTDAVMMLTASEADCAGREADYRSALDWLRAMIKLPYQPEALEQLNSVYLIDEDSTLEHLALVEEFGPIRDRDAWYTLADEIETLTDEDRQPVSDDDRSLYRKSFEAWCERQRLSNTA